MLKKGIEYLLQDYFLQFKNKVVNKGTTTLSEKSLTELEISFKIILLNQFFNHVPDSYSKSQVWGYLISEFEVDRIDSIGYSILSKDSERNSKPISIASDDVKLSNGDAVETLFSVNEFISDKIMKKFEKEFRSKLAYGLTVAKSISIPLLERDDMRCRCGSNKVFGEKITCTKCGLSQHLTCVGMSVDANSNGYLCPVCWMDEPPIESAATLIMVPPSLAVQWQNEVRKINLKLLIYSYS